MLVLIAAILLCTVRCCIWCRQRRKQREFNRERNDSLDPAALWDGEGRTCPVKESYPPDSQGAEVQMPLKAKHFRVRPHHSPTGLLHWCRSPDILAQERMPASAVVADARHRMLSSLVEHWKPVWKTVALPADQCTTSLFHAQPVRRCSASIADCACRPDAQRHAVVVTGRSQRHCASSGLWARVGCWPFELCKLEC